MRVIAGTARGRRLRAPATDATRPMTDRVRESVFNMLAARGLLEGATVADVFAGSGALGIEALSRGAATVTFVDREAAAIRIIERNLADLGMAAGARVITADALAWMAGAPGVDLAFVCPPYAFGDWPSVLSSLQAEVAVLESDRPLEPGPRWETATQRRYGTTVVAIVQRRGEE